MAAAHAGPRRPNVGARGGLLAGCYGRAEQLRRNVADLDVLFMGKPLPRLTFSIGASVFPYGGASGAAVPAASDAALYLAKTGGRDEVVMAKVTPEPAPPDGAVACAEPAPAPA